jgi:hypothetical protein
MRGNAGAYGELGGGVPLLGVALVIWKLSSSTVPDQVTPDWPVNQTPIQRSGAVVALGSVYVIWCQLPSAAMEVHGALRQVPLASCRATPAFKPDVGAFSQTLTWAPAPTVVGGTTQAEPQVVDVAPLRSTARQRVPV